MNNKEIQEYWYKSIAERIQGNSFRCAREKFVVLKQLLINYDVKQKSKIEIGCGACHLAIELGWTNYTGVDIHNAGFEFASKRIPGARLIQSRADSIPLSDKFDVIMAFDSLEHIPLDMCFASKVFDMSHDETIFIGNVPVRNNKHSHSPDVEHYMDYQTLEYFMRACGFFQLKTIQYWVAGINKDVVTHTPFIFFEARRNIIGTILR
jgi:2-polyprenyl-3-methyl-5-hydroxy-6-metoxy-1,4-benzoquinol methylase